MTQIYEPETRVNCAGCTACCHGQMVALTDMPCDAWALSQGRWHWEYSPVVQKRVRVLDVQQENGDCTYMIEGRCTIYPNRPAMCRSFSCTRLAAKIMEDYPTRAERRRLGRSGIIDQEIFAAGITRLAEERAEHSALAETKKVGHESIR